MNLFNTILLLIIFESIFNTDVYGLKNIIGSIVDIILNALIIFCGFYFLINKKNDNYVKGNFYFFIFLSFFSTLINQTSFIDTMEFILRYGKIYFTFFIGYRLSESFDEINLFKTLTLINLINFLLNIFWMFDLKFLANKYIGTIDFATGLFGDALYQCLFSTIVLAFSCLLLLKKEIYRKDILYFNIISSLIQILVSYSYHFFVVIFFAFTFSLIIFKSLKDTLKIILPIIFILFLFNNFSKSEYFSNSFITLLNSSPKIASYRDTFLNEYQKPYQVIFGVGPGNGGSYIAIENNARIAENYFSIYDYFTEKFRRGSITTLPNTAITTLKSELGYLGLINFFALIVYLISFMKNFTSRLKSPIIAPFSVFIIFLFLLENIFADYLQHSLFPILTFLLLGYCFGKR